MKNSIKLLVAYHKPASLIKTSNYVPIHAGRALALESSKDGNITENEYKWLLNNMIGDDTGENISTLNRNFNEMSVIYWAWKNYNKLGSPEYIGFTHYRRQFLLKEPKKKNYKRWLNNSEVFEFKKLDNRYLKLIEPPQTLGNFDIGVPYLYDLKNINENYRSPKDNYEALGHKLIYFDKMVEIIRHDYPNYIDALNEFLSGTSIYLCNLFIMKKELFNEYCIFAFDILFKIKSQVEDKEFSIHEKRGLAFLSEFIATIFVFEKNRQGKKIKHFYTTYLEFTDLYGKPPREPFVEKLLSVKNSYNHKIIQILGIKFKFKCQKLVMRNQINSISDKLNYIENDLNEIKELLKAKENNEKCRLGETQQ